MKFKLNLWTSWKILAFFTMLSYFLFDYSDMYFWIGVIIHILATGFKNIEDKLGIETNLFKFSWKKTKVNDGEKRIINE